ncbi:MAG: hypothetical protein EOO05_09595 [Chitinophagaceae bacterium]|nr:MAG: hypothetical protein EOO05_09595 [Chitinophagaceae bacterium]
MVFLSLPACLNARATDNASRCNRTQQDSVPAFSSRILYVLIHKPFGRFDKSHSVGFGAEYAISPGHFGSESKPAHKLGRIAWAGADFFIGSYPFRYSNYLYAHVMAGAIYNPVSFGNVFLVAGPGVGLYNGSATVGLNAAASANIVTGRNISVGPAVTFRKHKEADALWTAGVRIGLLLP